MTRIVAYFPTADELRFDPDATFPAAVGTATTESAGHHEHTEHRDDHRLQGYVWHCHVLDHEDHDMMLQVSDRRSVTHDPEPVQGRELVAFTVRSVHTDRAV